MHALLSRNPILFVWIILGFNALAIALYFSGNTALQQIIAPTLDTLRPSQWREFGLLEIVQTGVLIAIIWILFVTAIRRTHIAEKVVLFIGTAAFIFLFLEEIDYGLHFYELLTGKHSSVVSRNWHNQWKGDVENATILKRLNDAAIILWFVLLPALARMRFLGR